jgi:hypothetical protein
MNNNIIERLERIETKLDAVIAALHEYDNDGYGESSFEAFMDSKDDIMSWKVDGAERILPCVGHDATSWDEGVINARMDIIGQNGNEGSHYVTNEEADEDAFSDYGMRIAKKVMSDKDNVRVGKDKSNNTQPKQKQYWKNNRSKRAENKK